MIVECIVTSAAPDGAVNVAPMGVEWGEESLILKPFLETVTFRNLVATRAAVVNVTDDALLFARAILSNPAVALVPADRVHGWRLADVCSWREVEIESVDDTPPRARMIARVVHRGSGREWLGFNRARHAVLEAAILATRTHLLPPALIRDEMSKLRVIVDKTAGPRELEAMTLLEGHVAAALERRAESPSATAAP